MICQEVRASHVMAVALALGALVGPADGLQEAAVPSFAAVRAAHVASERPVLDREGRVLHALRIDTSARRGEWTALERMSPALVEVVLVSEDRRFQSHDGVDWQAVTSAALAGLGARLSGAEAAPRGASTITMQLVALLDPSLARPIGGRDFERKRLQMQAARALERQWSKAQILEAYLNRVSFRGELQGIAAASERLFGKAPHGLDAAESALLAALLRGPQAARQRLERRACLLLRELGRAEECARLAFLIDRFTLPEHAYRLHADQRIAPHAARLLAQRVPGRAPIESTLDADLQREARAAIRRHLAALVGRNAHDAAVVVLDNASGDVLAYVGSSGALSDAQEVDAARAARQAGSTLKPFIYALALERRLLTTAALLDDAPFSVDMGGGTYAPQNYGEDYVGPVSVRTALASSLNIPALRALDLVGVRSVHRLLGAFGFGTLVADPEHYGHSLALGSADVTLLDLTNAYRGLARGGLVGPVRWVRSGEGALAPSKRVLSPQVAWLVGDILADRGARYLTFGFDNPLAVDHWAAVKTGTSKDMRDNWAVGWNARVTVGVWVGNARGAPMHGVTGVTGAGPIWAEVIEAAARRYGAGLPPSPPTGLVATSVRWVEAEGEGSARTRRAPEGRRREWFLAGTEPPHGEIAVRVAPTVGPRIVSPGDGIVLALDPDIPHGHQRLRITSGEPATARCFRLDSSASVSSVMLGCADHIEWAPEPGEHIIVLVDHEGREYDRRRVTVRGAGARW